LAKGDTDGRHLERPAMVQGLIHDIPTVKDLVDRIVAEAEALIRGRLAAMVG
jgi:NADH:quinone reductase (non-electrogenic)